MYICIVEINIWILLGWYLLGTVPLFLFVKYKLKQRIDLTWKILFILFGFTGIVGLLLVLVGLFAISLDEL